mmetsp:Transcript_8910/g.25473  ORF Transcript_8910/g.25473 Transcript_8910/m.25473 type:complete len:372 (-) Transcript_8910:139-1254(-)
MHDGSDHACLGAEDKGELVLSAGLDSVLSHGTNKVQDVGGRAHHATPILGGLVGNSKHLAGDFEVGRVVGVGVVGAEHFRHFAAKLVVDHAVALGKYLEVVECRAQGLRSVVRMETADLVGRQLGEAGEETPKVLAHVRVGSIPHRQIWDLTEGLQHCAEHVAGRARDRRHEGLGLGLGEERRVDVHDVEAPLACCCLAQPGPVGWCLCGGSEGAANVLLRDAVHGQVLEPLGLEGRLDGLGHEVHTQAHYGCGSLASHLDGRVAHGKAVRSEDVGPRQAAKDALELRIHVVVGNDSRLRPAEGIVEAGHIVGVGVKVSQLGLSKRAVRGQPLRGDRERREGSRRETAAGGCGERSRGPPDGRRQAEHGST